MNSPRLNQISSPCTSDKFPRKYTPVASFLIFWVSLLSSFNQRFYFHVSGRRLSSRVLQGCVCMLHTSSSFHSLISQSDFFTFSHRGAPLCTYRSREPPVLLRQGETRVFLMRVTTNGLPLGFTDKWQLSPSIRVAFIIHTEGASYHYSTFYCFFLSQTTFTLSEQTLLLEPTHSSLPN